MVSPNIATTTGVISFTFDIENTGSVSGDEVPQLYIRDVVSTVTTPIKQLYDFTRITIPAGETQTVTFNLSVAKWLWIINREYEKEVEPGFFNAMIGPSSGETLLESVFEVI